jgi:DNA-directed RNA polymerase subunit M/transcription elongation factor TFIIS
MEEIKNKIIELTNEYFFTQLENSIEYKIKKSCIKEQQFIFDIKNNFYQKVIKDIELYIEHDYDKNDMFVIIDNPFWYKEKWDTIKENITNKIKDKETFLATTDRFTCSKCKGNKCVYNEKQTRSADEPTTKYVTCVLCGYKWTFC